MIFLPRFALCRAGNPSCFVPAEIILEVGRFEKCRLLCYNQIGFKCQLYAERHRKEEMNMDLHKWLSALLQLLILIPGAASCYLPAKKHMKYTIPGTSALCAAVILPYCFTIASLHALFSINIKGIAFLSLVPFFFLYRRTMNLDLPRSLAIYVGVCAIETFPAQFAYAFDAAIHPESGAADFSLEAGLFQLALSALLFLAFFFPATIRFSRAVDSVSLPKIWYATVALSSIFLVFNILATPLSYSTLHTGRMYGLFLGFEAIALGVLVGIYALFYRSSALMLEQAARSQLLEMQSQQYLALQEHIRQTAKLRHDFRHSIRLIASLAEQGDTDSIQAHIAEYETMLDRHAIANYCKNAALNALFGYYHEMAAAADIRTDWNIRLPEPLPFSELDITWLFGNLMENAIAGCRTVPRDSRYFRLAAEVRHGNRLYIVSTNSFDGKVRKGKDGYRSTRHDGNAIGLSAIAAAAEKYGGNAKASNSDTEFFVDVMMEIDATKAG